MKKIIVKSITILTLLSFLIFPTVTLASWWNPFSWSFWNVSKPKTSIIVAPNTPNVSTETKTNNFQQSNQKNTVSSNTGIGKSPKQQNFNDANTKLQPVSSANGDIKQKIQYIVQIVCPIKGGTMSGTGIVMYGNSSTDNKVITNKHVLNGAIGACGIYKTYNYENQPTLYYKSSITFIFSSNNDLAIITPDVPKLTGYQDTNVIFNDSNDILDKNIYVLGYPASAGNNITLTRGIISGTENINGILMYKTDAKIDSGNSGGAVFDENGNFIGVPTLASQGNFSSYGYIIPASVVKSFLNTVEQEGYIKQNWQNPALSLYSVSPSNTVPEPPSSATQNPAPNNPTPSNPTSPSVVIVLPPPVLPPIVLKPTVVGIHVTSTTSNTAWIYWFSQVLDQKIEYSINPDLSSSKIVEAGFNVAKLDGLTPNTVYYFRIIAKNSGGEFKSDINNFTTSAQ